MIKLHGKLQGRWGGGVAFSRCLAGAFGGSRRLPSPSKGLEVGVLHVQQSISPENWCGSTVAVTTTGLSMLADLVELAGMGSERWSVLKTVLEPIYMVGHWQGVAG